jgi:hypothetical protein
LAELYIAGYLVKIGYPVKTFFYKMYTSKPESKNYKQATPHVIPSPAITGISGVSSNFFCPLDLGCYRTGILRVYTPLEYILHRELIIFMLYMTLCQTHGRNVLFSFFEKYNDLIWHVYVVYILYKDNSTAPNERGSYNFSLNKKILCCGQIN